MNDRVAVEMRHGGHEAILEFLFGCDADVAQHRAGDFGKEALHEIAARRYRSAATVAMDSPRYWVQEIHVDGFRFDLATTIAREQVAVSTRFPDFSTPSGRVRSPRW